MTIDLACAECEASFELDVTELLDEPGSIVCPNCDAKAPKRKAEALASSLDELLRAIAALADKFNVTLSAETDDLPPSFEPAGGKRRAMPAEEDEEEEEEEADEDEDEAFGEDEDLEDEGDPED
ncbi:MAG TPA: hypothetical protein VMB50_04175 [Myxococcales bacterium]|nr:hypothetical protein [Myxococcales bacterium]